jgi:hypothetical protein
MQKYRSSWGDGLLRNKARISKSGLACSSLTLEQRRLKTRFRVALELTSQPASTRHSKTRAGRDRKTLDWLRFLSRWLQLGLGNQLLPSLAGQRASLLLVLESAKTTPNRPKSIQPDLHNQLQVSTIWSHFTWTSSDALPNSKVRSYLTKFR